MGIRRRGASWVVDVSINGKRKTATAENEREAEIIESRLRTSLLEEAQEALLTEEVEVLDKKSWTLRQAVEYTCRHVWSGTKGEQAALKNINKIMTFFKGTTYIKNIDTESVDEFIETLKEDSLSGDGQKKALSNASINRALSALSKVFTVADERGYLTKRPIIKFQKEFAGRIRWMTYEEEALMYAAFGHFGLTDHQDCFAILLDTGFRPNELWTLKWHNVNLENRTLTIWAEQNKTATNRTIGMTDRVFQIFDERRQTIKDAFSPIMGDLDNHWFLRGFKRVRQHVGLDDLVIPYTCRHTCCSRFVQSGMDLTRVKAWMGHSSLTTTLRYAHLAPKNVTDMAARLDAYRHLTAI